MNLFNKIFKKKVEEKEPSITVTVSKLDASKCLCEHNAEGKGISGWCHKHKTDWV